VLSLLVTSHTIYVDLDQPNEDTGLTPLHACAAVGNLEAMKLLIKKGADVNRVSSKGTRPYDTAVHNRRKEVSKSASACASERARASEHRRRRTCVHRCRLLIWSTLRSTPPLPPSNIPPPPPTDHQLPGAPVPVLHRGDPGRQHGHH
jgi:hypothetical protein